MSDTTSKLPELGEMMPDFSLPSTDGRDIRISNFRGDRNLVLAFVDGAGCDQCRRLLQDLASDYHDIQGAEAVVIAVVEGPLEAAKAIKEGGRLPFLVVADEGGHVHRRVGAMAAGGEPAPAVYITDRYNQIYMAQRAGDGDPLPSASAMIDRLDYIEIQCPE